MSALVTDPPYGIGFMGQEWDAPSIDDAARRDAETRRSLGPESATRPGRAQPRSSSAFGSAAHYAGPVRAGVEFQIWCEAWAAEALRVLKPGGHMLVFGGTRTYHRLAAGIEDAGFEVRDTMAWLFGSGFPKSLDVSKAIDRAAGAAREVVGPKVSPDGIAYADRHGNRSGRSGGIAGDPVTVAESTEVITAPATPEAAAWDGWGTALKPAFEPIVVARKPLAGTVAGNVLEHGTGAMNIDACRVAVGEPDGRSRERAGEASAAERRAPVDGAAFAMAPGPRGGAAEGRWPANVVLDEEAAELLDAQTGTLRSGRAAAGGHRRSADRTRTAYGAFAGQEVEGDVLYGDKGGASRFFYTAKASRAEREAGLGGISAAFGSAHALRNDHPTVKPIALMRWLVRLVTPPDGVVLDLFAGSGTTVCAGAVERLQVVGIEREPGYVAIARRRAAWWAEHPDGVELVDRLVAERARREIDERGQMDILSILEEAA